MKKLVGVFLFLVVVYGAYVGSMFMQGASDDRYLLGHRILSQRIGLFGILTLAAGLVIITGNIDLSMGSQVALCSTVFCTLAMKYELPLYASVPLTIVVGSLLGLLVGLVVTKLRVQSFIVTLCGMFIFRGLARLLTGDKKIGLETSYEGVKDFFQGTESGVPMFLMVTLVLLAFAILLLHFTVWGRYFLAIGSNERAASFAGIPTDRYKILAFVISSTLVGLYSFFFVLENNSVNPNDTGNMSELYAIAGAVLGGCSLRGGDGTAIGLFIGTCIIQILPTVTDNWLTLLLPQEVLKEISIDSIIPVAIGLALLGGAIVDEVLRRRQSKKPN